MGVGIGIPAEIATPVFFFLPILTQFCVHHAVLEWTRPITQEYPETWDEPDESFESFVSETVRYRLGKVRWG